MDFIAIDFETANQFRSSPCEIGITIVNNNEIIKTTSWLVKPASHHKFNQFNIGIHGITPEMVSNASEFDIIWEQLKPIINNKTLVAHNAAFDSSVLRKTLEEYGIELPELNYMCSCILSKSVWPGLISYNLKSLCKIHEISFNHHRAADDSLACALLTLRALQELGINDFSELQNKLSATHFPSKNINTVPVIQEKII